MKPSERLGDRLRRLERRARFLRERLVQLPLALHELLEWMDRASIQEMMVELGASAWSCVRSSQRAHHAPGTGGARSRTYADVSAIYYYRAMQHARMLQAGVKGIAVLYADALGHDAASAEQDTQSLCGSIAFQLLSAIPTGYNGPNYFQRPELVGRLDLIEAEARAEFRRQFNDLRVVAADRATALQLIGSPDEPFPWMGLVRRWLSSGLGEPIAPPNPGRVFARMGRRWRLVFDGREALLGGLDGFAYLHELVRRQGSEVPLVELERAAGEGRAHAGLDRSVSDEPDDARTAAASRAGWAADSEGVSQLRDAIKKLENEMSDDAHIGTSERLEGQRQELQDLRGELSRRVGLGGKLRPQQNPHEDRRLRIAKALGRALTALGKEHPAAAAHFRAALRRPFGRSPSYAPSPTIEWTLV